MVQMDNLEQLELRDHKVQLDPLVQMEQPQQFRFLLQLQVEKAQMHL
tara:strand:- start:80 stop:220 length:141 start_codon:yes stop_codon:yes gene_type:complete